MLFRSGHPGYWISRVIASNTGEAAAYVTITGYRHDDFRPWVYKTTDYGKTWKSIASNLPADESICVIREHPANPSLLFVGSTKAVYVSFDGGQKWNLFRNNMPNNPVEDIQIHPREKDLIVGTHGRSIFIADISYLEEVSTATLAKDVHLFTPETKVKWQSLPGNHSPYINYNGPSEPVAAHIYYYLKGEAGSAKIQVLDGARVIFESDVEKGRGVNRFLWNYSVRPPSQAVAGEGTDRAAMVRTAAASARPGAYTIRLIVDGKVADAPFTLLQDTWFDK